jgi:hypothetical protein
LDPKDGPIAQVGTARSDAQAPGAAQPPALEEPPALDPQRAVAKDRPKPPAIGFEPPAPDEASRPASPPPPISKEEFEEEVRKEAERKEAEQRELEEVTPQSRYDQLVEAIKKTQSDRVPFHNELRAILKDRGNKTGSLIARLCDQYGRDVHPSVRVYVVSVALIKAPLRATAQDRVDIMRECGMPEPMILDYLANDLEKRTRSARNAPRTPDDLRILAARQLIAMPVTKSSDAQIDRRAQAIVKFVLSAPAPSPRKPRRR